MSDALVVADDLTGAMDTGHQFAVRGYCVTVELDPALSADGVVVVDTDSRYLAPDVAAERVREAVERRSPAHIYKKVDSTLRGNVTAEVDAALEAAEARNALVAPAFPANDRVTACGYHLLEGKPVDDTAPGRDPDKPVTTAHLPTLFAASHHPVEHIAVDIVASGPDAVVEAMSEAPAPSVVVADAVHEAHLKALADGGNDVVYVGSAGLAAHVQLPNVARSEVSSVHEPNAARVLGVAGSIDPRTLRQLEEVEDSVVELDAPTAVVNPERAATDAADAVRVRLEAGQPTVVTSARSTDDVDAAMTAAASQDVTEDEARKRITRALALSAERSLGGDPVGLFLTGGAVARAVLDRLDARGIQLSGDAVATGIPVGRVGGGSMDGVPVVTKAGGFGESTAIGDAIAFLARDG